MASVMVSVRMHVGDQDAREQEQADAGRQAPARRKGRPGSENAQAPNRAVSQHSSDREQRDGNAAPPNRARRKSCTRRRSSSI